MKTAIHPVPSFSIASSPSGAALLHMSGALMLILLLIVALAWIARRSRWLPQRGRECRKLTIVGTHSLGQRERLVVVEMAGKHLLLGVTATQISRLAMFDKPEGETAIGEQALFQPQLHAWLKKREKGAGQ